MPFRRLLLPCATILASLVATAEGAEPRPHVVLILADDLGIHDLSCYGRAEHATPRLAALARQGALFQAAYCAQPICSASRAALMTGLSPARLQLTTYLPGRADATSQKLLQAACRSALPPEETTLGEVFARAGYQTCYIGKWHLGGGASGPSAQGFAECHYVDQHIRSPDTKGERELTAAALSFLRAEHPRPFLLVLSHHTPHIPLAATDDEMARQSACFNPAYAAMLARLDESVGHVLDALDGRGLADDTIVVFTSDNGGLHVPEGGFAPATHNSPFRAGKGFLYEGGLRVPLVVRWPRRVPARRVIDAPVVNTDLLPTLCALAGIESPRSLDGESMAGVLLGDASPRERTFYWHFPHYTNQGSRPAGAIRRGPWKIIEHYEDGSLELFQVEEDPGETRSRHEEQPATVRELLAALQQWRRQVGAVENRPNPAFSPELHRLIYLDTDVSRLRPAETAAEMLPSLSTWRAAIDAAVK